MKFLPICVVLAIAIFVSFPCKTQSESQTTPDIGFTALGNAVVGYVQAAENRVKAERSQALSKSKSQKDIEGSELRRANTGNDLLNALINPYYVVVRTLVNNLTATIIQLVSGLITTPIGPLAPYVQKSELFTSFIDILTDLISGIGVRIGNAPMVFVEGILRRYT